MSGNYNFTLTLIDESNHIITDTVMVQIYVRATTNDGTVTPKSSGGEIIDIRQITPIVIGSILALGLISFFSRR